MRIPVYVTDNVAKYKKAAEELLTTVPADAVQAMALWWEKWYRTAGHRRLGRLLVQYAKGGIPEKE